MTVAGYDTRHPWHLRGVVVLAALGVLPLVAGCASNGPTTDVDSTTMAPLPTTSSAAEAADLIGASGTAEPGSPSPTGGDPGDSTIASTLPATVPTSAASSVVATTSTLVQAPTTSRDPTTTSGALPTTRYLVPMADPGAAGWGDGHSGYPATDIFAACGAEIVSPVDGVVTEVRTVDSWDAGVDNPATRGGRSVTIVGDDGVRYYFAHFDEIHGEIVVGDRIGAGARLGTVGLTGRTSGCHLHFAISPPCPGKEWSVRRGVIPPKPYLDAWRAGLQPSPRAEVLAWSNDNPGACEEAMNDPFAQDS